jgi:biotin operon repressor
MQAVGLVRTKVVAASCLLPREGNEVVAAAQQREAKVPSREDRALRAAKLLSEGKPRQKVQQSLGVSRVTLWRELKLLRYHHEGQPIGHIRDAIQGRR